MAEILRYFQFVAGLRRGEILIFDSIEREDGMIFIKFKDDSRINEALVAQINQNNLSDKLMAEIDSPVNCWQFKDKEEMDRERAAKNRSTPGVLPPGVYIPETVEASFVGNSMSQIPYEVPSIDDVAHADLTGSSGVVNPRDKKKIIELIPPRPTPPTHSVFGAIKASYNTPDPVIDTTVKSIPTQQTSSNAVQQVNSNDPIWLMCNSSKKFDTQVSLTLTISLPKKSFYNVAKESFENGGEKVVEYIIQNLDNQKIKDSLKVALLSAYDDSDPVKPVIKETFKEVEK